MTAVNAFDRDFPQFPEGFFRMTDMSAAEARARQIQAAYIAGALVGSYGILKRGVTAIVRRVRAVMERRQALAQLSQLDDRLLADIGLNRGNLIGQLLAAEAAIANRPVELTDYVRPAAPVATPANADTPAGRARNVA
ncbi:DUF1127 domain-containing protein [Inquilinus sp. CAU 1745]|uniref:DUF1127 domain-containing protein n=1 Tax=Inquilinus sp. CAU 1745 TaxID=3140369 RepID=UPI00325B1DE6